MKLPKEVTRLLEQYRRAVDVSTIVSKTNKKGIITYANDTFCRISGYTSSELIGKPHNIVRHPDTPKEVFAELWNTIKNNQIWHGVICNRSKNGSNYYVNTTVVPIVNQNDEIVEYMAIRQDISELMELKAVLEKEKQKYKKLASFDYLTGIFNRLKFTELFQEIMNLRTHWGNLNLLMFDIDHFKKINDMYGHHVGDKVLQDLTNIIGEVLDSKDIFARIGGEEFIVLLVNKDCRQAKEKAELIRTTIESYRFDSVNQVTVSLGMVKITEDDTIDTYMKKADSALYQAKSLGRNQLVIY